MLELRNDIHILRCALIVEAPKCASNTIITIEYHKLYFVLCIHVAVSAFFIAKRLGARPRVGMFVIASPATHVIVRHRSQRPPRSSSSGIPPVSRTPGPAAIALSDRPSLVYLGKE